MQRLPPSGLNSAQIKRVSEFLLYRLGLAFAKNQPPYDALCRAFSHVYNKDQVSTQARATFLLIAAPIVRRFTIEHAPPSQPLTLSISTEEVAKWIRRLERSTPITARVIDL